MSDGNEKPDGGSVETKKREETAPENDDIEDDDLQHSDDERVKGNNNSNDIIGATEGNRRFRRSKTNSNTNSNDRFKQVDYKFDLLHYSTFFILRNLKTSL